MRWCARAILVGIALSVLVSAVLMATLPSGSLFASVRVARPCDESCCVAPGGAATPSSPVKHAGGDEEDEEDEEVWFLAGREVGPSRETCLQGADESELCVVDRLMCLDGRTVLVGTDEEPVLAGDLSFGDKEHSCFDFRFYESSTPDWSSCRNDGPFFRDGALADVPRRSWGPRNRHLLVDPVALASLGAVRAPRGKPPPPSRLPRASATPTPATATANATANANATTAKAMATAKAASSAARALDVVSAPEIEWVEGGLWIGGMHPDWGAHLFHFASKALLLWEAQRRNQSWPESHSKDGGLPRCGGDTPSSAPPASSSSSSSSTSSSSLSSSSRSTPSSRPSLFSETHRFPSIDAVAFPTPLRGGVEDEGQMHPWTHGLLRSVVPPKARLLGQAKLRSLGRHSRLVCATHGVVLGMKPGLVSGVGDGWALRDQVLRHLGLNATVRPHEHFPPAHILFIDRKSWMGRGFVNREAVLAALNRTGLPVHVVDDLESRSFRDQVQLMAKAGIVVAAHGAALTNILFLPSHAVVVEVFPYALRKHTYQWLAGALHLGYEAVVAVEKPPESLAPALWTPAFVNHCERRNTSLPDQLLRSDCNGPAKRSPIVVPIPALEEALSRARQHIGAFSLDRPDRLRQAVARSDLRQLRAYNALLDTHHRLQSLQDGLAETLRRGLDLSAGQREAMEHVREQFAAYVPTAVARVARLPAPRVDDLSGLHSAEEATRRMENRRHAREALSITQLALEATRSAILDTELALAEQPTH